MKYLGCVGNAKTLYLAGNEGNTNMDSRKRQEMNSKKGVLTAPEVIHIRELLALGEHPKTIADMYMVSITTITRIRDGVTWGWLPTEEHSEAYVEVMMQKPLTPEETADAQKSLERLLTMQLDVQPHKAQTVAEHSAVGFGKELDELKGDGK
jgi:hypothetical protein